MKKEVLENKKLDLELENKSNKAKNQYKVINSFCGIEKGHVMTINDKAVAKHMLTNKYVVKC